MRLEWSVFALSDRDETFTYIEADNPRAAIAVDDRIRNQINLLKEFPEAGRIGRVEGTRELIISQTPYIVAYRVTDICVIILRVLHGSRQWPDSMGPNEKPD